MLIAGNVSYITLDKQSSELESYTYAKRDLVSSAAIFNKDIVIKYGSVNKGSSKSRRT